MKQHEHEKHPEKHEAGERRPMEDNRYARRRQEVRAICDRDGVDVGVGCAILRNEKNWTFADTGGIDHELTEFVRWFNRLSAEEKAAFWEEKTE